MPREEWRVSAVYDTKEQAQQAAATLAANMPREWSVSAWVDDRLVWSEEGYDYQALRVRVR